MITRNEEHHSASSIASHARRPPLRRPLFAVLTLLCVALPWATSADAAEFAKAGERHMEVVQVEGAIDPVVAALITSSIRRAQTNGASVVILQIDSKGALDTDPAELLGALGGNRVPLVVWVGPGKATARGAAAFLVAAASFSAALHQHASGHLRNLFVIIEVRHFLAHHLYGVEYSPTSHAAEFVELGPFVVSHRCILQ